MKECPRDPQISLNKKDTYLSINLENRDFLRIS